MAVHLSGEKGIDYRRGDMFFVDPNKVLVRNDLRGRRFAPKDEDIIRMAISLYVYGQIQPCEIRTIQHGGENNVPLLNSGFTRCSAARLLREGFQVPDDFAPGEVEGAEAQRHANPGEFIQDENFMLKVMKVSCNDKEAFEHNIIENALRNQTSDIDDAHNQERLRSQYGYSDAKIARLYQWKSQVKVGKLKKLLQLPDEVQQLVHYEKLATTAALDLLDRPREEWEEILAAAKKEDGAINGTEVRNIVRDKQLSDFENSEEMQVASSESSNEAGALPDEEENESAPVGRRSAATTTTQQATPTKATKSRTMTDLRKFLKKRTGKDKEFDYAEPIDKLFATLLQWCNGQRTDVTLEKAVINVFEANADEYAFDPETEADAEADADAKE